MNKRWFFLYLLAFSCVSAKATPLCFKQVGKYYNIDPVLLESIAKVESNFKHDAIGINKNSKGKVTSKDYGIMQINQLHVSSLIKNKIITSEKDLINNPCLNIQIGAWILHKHFKKCGTNWQCLGTYNVGFGDSKNSLKRKYMVKVYKTYTELYSSAARKKTRENIKK